MESCRASLAVEVICRYGVVDRELLRHAAGLDDRSIEMLIGALLSSGYIVEVEPRAELCGSCPLSAECEQLKRGVGTKVYVLSDRFRRLCDELVGPRS